MSFRISAYAQYQVTLNHQKKSANVSMAVDRIKYHAMRRLANQLYGPPAETPPAPSPSRSGPRPIMDLAMPGRMLIISSLFHPPDHKSALKVLRNAYICSRRTSPNVHEMSFRIKYLCAVAIKPSSNHQKKLANVSIAAYFLLGLAIAPDMWASLPLGWRGCRRNRRPSADCGQKVLVHWPGGRATSRSRTVLQARRPTPAPTETGS